jgi:hypothetical protein
MKNRFLIIPALFTVTPPTRDCDIARHMQPNAKSVHAIKMFNRSSVMFKITIAIQASMAKGTKHRG